MPNFDPTLLNSLRDQLLATEGKSSLELEKGTIIGDEYVVVERINEGGCAVIYKCHRLSEKKKIYALKVTYPKSANAARRFQLEVMASYQVKHPNVLRSIDCIFHGKALAYIMEYAPGGDLRDILDANKVLPISTFLIIAKQLASGLEAIHEKEIVHRDIKPENILFSSDGQIKIADFGISFSSEVTRITANGSLVGTINYMAPEYVKRGVFDTRSDLYSLGILLYELLTLKHPFGYSRSLDELIEKITVDPEPPWNHRADCPNDLNELLLKMISIDPDERYQSARDILLDLNIIEKDCLFEKIGIPASILPETNKVDNSQVSNEKFVFMHKTISFLLFLLGSILLSIAFFKYLKL
jgi:eukaryotic-like serine/threonine-protein kinase